MMKLEIHKLIKIIVKIGVTKKIKMKIRNIKVKILKYFDKMLLNIFLN